jgi:hypothetical protein
MERTNRVTLIGKDGQVYLYPGGTTARQIETETAKGKRGIRVGLADDDGSFTPDKPTQLTPDQIERVALDVLEALTAAKSTQ